MILIVFGVLQLRVVLQRSLRTVYILTNWALNHRKLTCWSRTRSLNLRRCFFLRQDPPSRCERALLEASNCANSNNRCLKAVTFCANIYNSPQHNLPFPGKTQVGLLPSLHGAILTSKSRAAVIGHVYLAGGRMLAIISEDNDPKYPVPAVRTERSFDFSRLRMHILCSEYNRVKLIKSNMGT